MPHRSTHTDHRKIDTFLLKLKGPLAGIAQRVFAASDADARRHGWQVTITRGGFGRTYRDPRFDYLVECTACNGRGCKPGNTTCSPCHATGRIVLDPAALSRSRRGQP
jgi:DnaJ-class molecular chaperone